ncbi:MAG: DUF4274 domain-containing protein [Erysipelotrichaceae bacterium]|jgi:hypothetical protein|nr:DUF4274 domain-containing protein [Erysipelotrichaceae bacterium]
MDKTVEKILYSKDKSTAAKQVAELTSEEQIWELMENYNWDDGYAVPLAAVSHPCFDRALALYLFWEIDEAPQHYYAGGEKGLREIYSYMLKYQPEEYPVLVKFCKTLVDGIRVGTYPISSHSYDTGFFGFDNPDLTESQTKLRMAKTKLKQKEYEDTFLMPVKAEADLFEDELKESQDGGR